MLALEKLINDYPELSSKVEIIVIADSVGYPVIGSLEFKGFYKILRVYQDPVFISFFLPSKIDGVVMFVSDFNKIIFAEELNFKNINKIYLLYKKVKNYLE